MRLWNRIIRFYSYRFFNAVGVSSLVGDDLHINLFDFDDMTLDAVKNTMFFSSFIEFAIYETSNKHYHVYTNKATSLGEFVKHLVNLGCCKNYICHVVKRGYAVLRITPKPHGELPYLVFETSGFKLPRLTLIEYESMITHDR